MKYLLTILILLIAISASATTYYVRVDGHNGASGLNNTNDGTTGAWLTVAYACSHTTSGDIISIQAGTFTETIQLTLPVGVSLEGIDTTQTVIRSTVTTDFTPILMLASGTENTNGNQHISNIRFEGRMLNDYGVAIVGRGNVKVYNCCIIDFKSNGLNYSGITSLTAPGAPTVYATGNEVYNNRIYNCSRNDTVYGRGCLQFGGQLGMLIHDNDIQQPYRTGTFTGDLGWPVKKANEGYIKGCKFYNNIAKRAIFTGTNHGTNNDWNFSFEMWNLAGLEMYNNVFQGEVDIVHAQKNYNDTGLYFHNNIISYPAIIGKDQTGIRLETDEVKVYILENTFENNSQVVLFAPNDYGNPGDSVGFGLTIDSIFIRNNLFKNIGKIGDPRIAFIFDNAGDARSVGCKATNIFVENNTFISDATYTSLIGITPPYYTGTNQNININNNIIQGFSYQGIFSNTGFGGTSTITDMSIRNNNFYLNASNILLNTTNVNYTNSGNITTNPLFAETTYYTLSSGSPCNTGGIGGTYIGYTGGADTTAPIVTSTSPVNGATNVSISVSPTITFNENLDGATVTTGSAYITGVTSSVSYNSGVITINPTSDLTPSTTYTVTITTAVTDVVGNALASTYTFTFTTAAGGGVNTTRNYCCPPY